MELQDSWQLGHVSGDSVVRNSGLKSPSWTRTYKKAASDSFYKGKSSHQKWMRPKVILTGSNPLPCQKEERWKFSVCHGEQDE